MSGRSSCAASQRGACCRRSSSPEEEAGDKEEKKKKEEDEERKTTREKEREERDIPTTVLKEEKDTPTGEEKKEEEGIRMGMMLRSMLTDFAQARRRILSKAPHGALPLKWPSESSFSSPTFSSSHQARHSSSSHGERLSSAVTSSSSWHRRPASLSEETVSLLLSSLLSSLTSLIWCTAFLHERYRYGGVYLSLTGRLNTATMPSSDSGDLEITSFSLAFFSYLLLSFPYLFYGVLPLPSPLSRLSHATVAFKSSFLLLSYVHPHAARDLLRRSTKKMTMLHTEKKEKKLSISLLGGGKKNHRGLGEQDEEEAEEDLMDLERRGGASDAVYTAGLPDRHTWLVQRKAEQLCLLATDFLSLSHDELLSSSSSSSDLFSLRYTQQGGVNLIIYWKLLLALVSSGGTSSSTVLLHTAGEASSDSADEEEEEEEGRRRTTGRTAMKKKKRRSNEEEETRKKEEAKEAQEREERKGRWLERSALGYAGGGSREGEAQAEETNKKATCSALSTEKKFRSPYSQASQSPDATHPSTNARPLSFIEEYRAVLAPSLQDVQMLFECFREVTSLYPLRVQEDFFLSLISKPPPLPDTAVGAILILFKKRWCDSVLSVKKSRVMEKLKETPPPPPSSSFSSSGALAETSVFQGRESRFGVEERDDKEEEKSEIPLGKTEGEKDGEGRHTNVQGGVHTPETCEDKEAIVEGGQKENALMFWKIIKCVLIDRKEEEEEDERIVESSERLTTILNWLKLCMYTPASLCSSSSSSLSNNACVVKREDSSFSSSSSSSSLPCCSSVSSSREPEKEKKEKEKKCIEESGEREEERMEKISTSPEAARPSAGSLSSPAFLQFGRFVWMKGRRDLERVLDKLTSQIDIELHLLQGKKEREEEKRKRFFTKAKNEEDVKKRKTGKEKEEDDQENEEEEDDDEKEKKNLSHGGRLGREFLSDDMLEIVVPEQRQKGREEGEKKKKKIQMKKRDEEELKLALVQAALRDVRDLSRQIPQ